MRLSRDHLLFNDDMTSPIRLAPAQQMAADRLSSSLSKGEIFVLRAQPGMGRTAVLAHVHAAAAGVFLGVRDLLCELTVRTPETIEEAFLAMLDRAVTNSGVVILDDLHLVRAIVDSCNYPRTNLLEAVLTAVMTEAAARNKKLIFGTDGDEPAPVTRRACIVEIAEFTPEDYTCICQAWLPAEIAGRIDYTQVHRFGPELTAHQLKTACQWFAANSGAATTDEFIAYLREHHLASNVDLDEVPPVDLRDLKGADEVIRALESKIALPLENDALAAQYGLKPKRGVLLAGPPGTGKTTIGRALAHRLKGKFFLIDGTVISGTDYFYRDVRRIFDAAKKNAPSVIFIDDSDVIFESKEEHGLYRYLLTMLDGLESASAGRVCVMMTAMNVGSLPRAMVRSGRVELWLETRLPDTDARVSILQGLLAGVPAPFDSADLERIAAYARGLTGAARRCGARRLHCGGRSRALVQPGFLAIRDGRRNGAKAAIAPAEFAHRGGQIALAEIGPQTRREDQLGIGALPEQEIAEAAFAAGANQQVDRRTESALQGFARQTGDAAGRREDGVAAGIVERNPQAEAMPARRRLFRLSDGPLQRGAQAIAAADDFQPDAVLHAAVRLFFEVVREQAHEGIDLGARAAPVVRGESK